MTWPIIVATGGPRERGRAYGQAARERVHGSIELYRAIFRQYTGLTWDQVRGRAGAFVEPIDALDVQLLPEMEGIAEGASVDAEDVLALNVRTEVMYGLGAPGAAAAECTALGLAAGRSAAGHVVVAENWDWKPRARDTCVLLVMVPPDRPGFATLVEAGLLAKSGMNETGVGQVVNALVSSRDRVRRERRSTRSCGGPSRAARSTRRWTPYSVPSARRRRTTSWARPRTESPMWRRLPAAPTWSP